MKYPAQSLKCGYSHLLSPIHVARVLVPANESAISSETEQGVLQVTGAKSPASSRPNLVMQVVKEARAEGGRSTPIAPQSASSMTGCPLELRCG